MKTSVFICVLGLSIAMPMTLSAQKDDKASKHDTEEVDDAKDEVKPVKVLTISGAIKDNEEYLSDVNVELFEGNTVIDQFVTGGGGKFKFDLYNDRIYTIQLSKEEFHTKRISVSTKLPEDRMAKYKFEFDINLETTINNRYNASLAEYPSALISFDEQKEEFFYDRNYTKTYFDEMDASKKASQK
jgi:hypothetical protein